MTTTVSIENIGPITQAEFELPEHGGVVLLTGANGRGKSTGLAALERSLTGNKRVKLEPSDGHARGRIRIEDPVLGIVTVNVSGTTRSSGLLNLEVHGPTDGIGAFIDPKIKDPEAADRARLKTLLSYSGLEIERALWEQHVGGQDRFLTLSSPQTQHETNPVDAAESLRRDLQTAARACEAQASSREEQSRALRQAVGETDLESPHDERQLANALEHAVERRSALSSQLSTYRREQERVTEGQRRLRELKSLACAPDLAQICTQVNEAAQTLAEASARLEAAQASYEAAKAHHSQVVELKAQAERYEQQLAEAERLAQESTVGPVADEEIEEANRTIETARQAVEQGAIIRRARQQQELADRYRREAEEAAAEGQRLRDLAGGIDDLLCVLLERLNLRLQYRGGRLCYPHRRGLIPLEQLSDGELRMAAIETYLELLARKRSPRALLYPQSDWETLDPDNQQRAHQLAIEHETWIITGRATRGPLTVTSFAQYAEVTDV